MNKKHEKTLEAIFKIPILSNVVWKDCEKLLTALGAEITEGEGSRVRIILNRVKAVFHRPHPKKEIDKGALDSLKKFLENAGIQPKEKDKP
ncbi:MAG: type II toxin-antitoxin system HicA family toxin [Parachlamydiales bacterium]